MQSLQNTTALACAVKVNTPPARDVNAVQSGTRTGTISTHRKCIFHPYKKTPYRIADVGVSTDHPLYEVAGSRTVIVHPTNVVYDERAQLRSRLGQADCGRVNGTVRVRRRQPHLFFQVVEVAIELGDPFLFFG